MVRRSLGQSGMDMEQTCEDEKKKPQVNMDPQNPRVVAENGLPQFSQFLDFMLL